MSPLHCVFKVRSFYIDTNVSVTKHVKLVLLNTNYQPILFCAVWRQNLIGVLTER